VLDAEALGVGLEVADAAALLGQVEMATPLSVTMMITGSFHTLAAFIASCMSPSAVVPSPTMPMVTPSLTPLLPQPSA
jgi:hypothetical protein